MDETVLVIVGDWDCGDDFQWKFTVSKKHMGRCVRFSNCMGFHEFMAEVKKVFCSDLVDCEVSLSFWYPEKFAIFTQGKTPPVSVASDSDFHMFKKKRLIQSGNMNMYLSILEKEGGVESIVDDDSSIDDEALIALVEKVEAAERQKLMTPVVPNSGFRRSQDMKRKMQPSEHTPCVAIRDENPRKQGRGDASIGPMALSKRSITTWSIGSSQLNFDVRNSLPLCNKDDCVMGTGERCSEDMETDLRRRSSRRALNGLFEEVAGISGNIVDLGSVYPSVCNQLVDKYVSQTSTEPSVGIASLSYVNIPVITSDASEVRSPAREYVEDDSGFDALIGVIEKENPSASASDKACESNLWLPRRELIPTSRLGENASWEVGESSARRCAQNVISDVQPDSVRLAVDDVENLGEDVIRIVPNDSENCGFEELDGLIVGNDSGYSSFGQLDGVTVVAPIIDEEEPLLNDAPPQCDNLRGLAPQERNMDLKLAEDAIYVGRLFATKKDLHKTLSLYAMRRLFCFKVSKSDTARVIAICIDKKCRWRVYAVKHFASDNFEVRTVQLKHSCDVQARSRYGEKATAKVLAGLLQSKFSNGKKGPRACDLPDMVLSELNVTISYMKAWHAKEVAVATARGNAEESFCFLSTYLHLVRSTNPGTITEMVTRLDKKGNTQFKFLFLAMGASIAGFKYLRMVVVIDGTQMKGKYKGCLVAACGQDGNMQVFPLAFGVVDGENEASWAWFFKNLTKFVPDAEDLVFVSDRHVAIYAGLRNVYPLAHHCACTVHLCRNVRSRFKGEGLVAVVSKAARSYTVGDFRYWWAEIQKRSPACAQYLLNIGLPHWTLSHCPGIRYNVMSSNVCETLNAAMLKAVEYPIVSMLEFLLMMLMRWFSTRRAMAKKSVYRCTNEIEKLLVENLREASECKVLDASEWIFQVNDGAGCVFTVDLEKKTCTCRSFDVLRVPCAHALAARAINDVDQYSLVGDCYGVKTWFKTYEQVVMPIPSVKDIDVPVSATDLTVNPPQTKRGSGRPRKLRIPSRGEGNYVGKKRIAKCGRCFQSGHNRMTCKAPI